MPLLAVSRCPALRMRFSREDVDPFARELCDNWAMKIASVRELVPRLLLEMAFLKSYRFLPPPDKTVLAALERLTKAIRGIADPLVATYVRAYLVYVVIGGAGGKSRCNLT